MLSSLLLESLFPHCVSANVILGLIAAWFYFVRDDLFSQGASSNDSAKGMSPLLKRAFHNVVSAVLVIAIALLCASLFAYQLKHINKDPVGIVESRKRFSVRYKGSYDPSYNTFDALTNISYDGSTVAAAAAIYFESGTSVVYLGPWTLGNLLTQQESLLSFSAFAILNSFANFFFSVAAGVTSTTWLFVQQVELNGLPDYNAPVMSSRDSQAASCLTPNTQNLIVASSAQCSPLDNTLGGTQINNNRYIIDTVQTTYQRVPLFAVKSLLPTFNSTLQVYNLDNQKKIAKASLISSLSSNILFSRKCAKTDDTANMTAITLDSATGALYARFSIVNGKGSLIAGHQWSLLAPLYTEKIIPNPDFPLTILRNVVFVPSVNKLFVTYVDNADNLLLAVYAPGADEPLFGPILLDTANPQFYTKDGFGSSNMVLNSQPHTPRLTYLRRKNLQSNAVSGTIEGTADLEFAILNFYL